MENLHILNYINCAACHAVPTIVIAASSLTISPAVSAEGTYIISPRDPLIQVSDCARVMKTADVIRMDRFINAAGGFQHDNPGARIRFRTDAKNIAAKFKFTRLHSRGDAINSMGLYMVNGRIAGSFQRNPKLDEAVVEFPQTDESVARDYELIMPYGDSVEFAGLTLRDGKLLPPSARPVFKYVAFGDSITHGFRAGDIGCTYPFMIGEKLQWQTVNMGFGSRTTVPADGNAIAACGGDVISILIGFNDFYGSKPITNYVRDFKGLIINIRTMQPETPVFLITPLWSSEPKWAASKIGLRLEDYRKAVRLIVADSHDAHLHLIEGLSLMDNLPEMTTDGIHPNDKGFAQVAERLASIFKQLVHK
jgi:lysophospholipase L1-like esterase